MNSRQTNPIGFPISVVVVDEHSTVTGGATRVAIDEAIALSEVGAAVTYFAAVGPICTELRSSKVNVVLLDQHHLAESWKHPAAAFQAIWNQVAYRAMGRLLNSLHVNSTVIHVHGYSKTMSASPIRCAIDRGFAVVTTLHDYFSACPNGGFFDYPTGQLCTRAPMSLRCLTHNCDKRSYAVKSYRALKTYVQREFGGMPTRVKNFIVLSDSSLSLLRSYLPNDANLFLLRNPCSVPHLPPADTASRNLVAVVGRLSPEKGIEIVVSAARDSGTQLLFIGDGPLRNIAEADGTHQVTGWVSRNQVHRLFDQVRCLILPSLVPETYGLSVVDAAARGVPSIVTNICGIAEYINHGTDGWRIPPGDVDSLAACLHAIKDDKIISTAGRAAYTRYWSAPLSLDTHICALLDIYRSILRPIVSD